MTPQEFAARINGRQYGSELTVEETRLAKSLGLVVIYGAGADLLELDGAISEEIGANDGTEARVGQYGALENFEDLHSRTEDESQFETYFRRKASGFAIVKAVWCPAKDEAAEPWASWAIETDVPHAAFHVFDGDDLFCVGVVLRLADLPGDPK